MASQIHDNFEPRTVSLLSIPPRDHRSDTEIISSLQTYQPVTSEKNLWAFWDRGLSRMPSWNQRNIINWVRRLGPSWTVHVVDLVPSSPTNIVHYVPESYFPASFNAHNMNGPHAGQHSSDLIRLPLLYLYGGIYIDAGTLLFRHLDSICWNALSDPSTPYEMAAFSIEFGPSGASTIFNGFIAARKGNGFVKRWHEIFLEVWRDKTSSEDMHAHPLLAHLPGFQPPVERLEATDLTVTYGQFLDYLAHNLCFERLSHLRDPSIGWDGPQYVIEKVLWFDAMQETYYAQKLTGWDGRKQFDLLSSPRECVKQNGMYPEAELFTENVMANSSTMKLSHGLPSGREYLAAIWDEDESGTADCRVGSWAEYLRHGSVYFEQTREMTPLVMVQNEDTVLEGGVTKVVGKKFYG